jgi:peptide/nickel transport system substrate-binding protein
MANGPRANNAYGQNALVRQALDAAIDRAALVNVVFNGVYVPTVQAVPPSSPFFDEALKVPGRDVAKAKALLQQAGATLPVRLDLLVINDPENMQAAEVVQSMANEAGFDVHLQAMEFASSLQAAVRGDYQAYMIGWSGRVDIDGNTYQFLHSNQANNNGNYASTAVDKLLEQARGLTDPARRRDLYAQMWPILREDLPFTYLWNPRNIVAMTGKLTGFRAVPDGMIRIQGLELAK